MSALTRYYQKLFGKDGGSSNFGEFGSLKAGSPTTTKDPSLIQSLAAWLTGWQDATIATNVPAYQDMNAVHYLAFYQICYLLQMGIAEWDSQTEYSTNSIVQYGGLLYTSLQGTNINQEPDLQPAYWVQGLPGSESVGVVKQYAGTTAPSGYFICDGTAKSRTTYANLFAVIGTIYGTGDGTTTFNIPDLRTRVPVGYKSGDADFGTLGNTGGEKTHTLTVPEVPALSLTIAAADANGSGVHQIQGTTNGASTNNYTFPTSGGGGAHNNLQPYIVLNSIIKY